MSIRDAAEQAERGRKAQQAQREAQRAREAEARPDALHRAVIFLIKAARENNPDLHEEASHHIATLDAELADMNKVAEIETPAPPAEPEEKKPAAATPKAPDTAAAIRQSRRFKRNS